MEKDARIRRIRELLLHYYRHGETYYKAHKIITSTPGEPTFSLNMARNWYEKWAKQRPGEETLEDDERGGRPQEIDREEIEALMDEEPRSSRQLAHATGYSHAQMQTILKELLYRYITDQDVPHDLTPQQKAQRVRICRRLLQLQNEKNFLDFLITTDEKWILLDNRKKGKHWVKEGNPRPQAPHVTHGDKVMLSVWFCKRGIIYWELIPEGEAVNAQRYIEIMERVQAALNNRPFKSWSSKHTLYLLHDNATPHKALDTGDAIFDIGWQEVDHPSHSPDMAPCDNTLFKSMAHDLEGRVFQDIDEVEEFLTEWFAGKSKDFYANAFDKLPQIWQDIIANDGEYVPIE